MNSYPKGQITYTELVNEIFNKLPPSCITLIFEYKIPIGCANLIYNSRCLLDVVGWHKSLVFENGKIVGHTVLPFYKQFCVKAHVPLEIKGYYPSRQTTCSSIEHTENNLAVLRETTPSPTETDYETDPAYEDWVNALIDYPSTDSDTEDTEYQYEDDTYNDATY